ncbi:MAG: hypothetical protein ACE5NP_00775 [Anaerolineae bacterium]
MGMSNLRYPTEHEVYEQNLREIRERGFGILLTWRDLGTLGADEPGWARVVLVGEEYNTFLLEIYPQSIAPFGDPETYIEDLISPEASAEYRQEVMDRIRAEHEEAFQSGRFIRLDTDHVGADEIERCIKTRVPELFPELADVALYVVDIAELEPWAEYWGEVEEAVQERYGIPLAEFLKSKEPLMKAPV